VQVNIEQVKIDKLIPYARNSRTHSDAQVAQIAASIKEFGFTNPVLIDETGSIIAGHGRVMAARKLAIADVPSIRLTHLTEAQKKAYIIADNKLALNAGWDDEMLAVELADLKDMGFDLDLIGFSTDEIKLLFGNLDDVLDDLREPVDESRNLLMIECQSERELEKLFEEMKERGLECKILS
jgi:ParB-like chromosome segregation protein Spo0J